MWYAASIDWNYTTAEHMDLSQSLHDASLIMPLPYYHIFPPGTRPNILNRHAYKLFDELYILSRILRQFTVLSHAYSARLPARHLDVGDLHVIQNIKICGKRGKLLSIVVVLGGNLNLVEVVKNVQLGQIECIVPVDRDAEFDDDEIEPAAAPFPAGGDAKFPADGLQFFADCIALFGRERSTTNTSSVGFDDANNFFDLPRVEVETGEDPSETGIGRSYVGVGAVVNVKHEGIGAFYKHAHISLDRRLDQRDLVDDERGETLAISIEALDLIFRIVLQEIAIAFLVSRREVSKLAVETFLVENVGNVNAATGGFGRVGRTDAFSSGADGTFT